MKRLSAFKCNQNAFIDSFLEIINTIVEEPIRVISSQKTRSCSTLDKISRQALKTKNGRESFNGIDRELFTIQGFN